MQASRVRGGGQAEGSATEHPGRRRHDWGVAVERGPDWLFLRLHDDESGSSAGNRQPLAERLWSMIRVNRAHRVVLELDRVEAVDDMLIGAIADVGTRVRDDGGLVRVCGLSKPNLLYYFRRKEDIYVAVLEHTLQDWLEPLRRLDASGEPLDEISRYIRSKIRLSRDSPKASRLFANEILHGAGAIGGYLKGPLKQLVDEKAAIIRRWTGEGRLAAIDPYHLIFAIWATTQHYADFDAQVHAITGNPPDLMSQAEDTLIALFVDGLRPRP